jgi:hypothetical protein
MLHLRGRADGTQLGMSAKQASETASHADAQASRGSSSGDRTQLDPGHQFFQLGCQPVPRLQQARKLCGSTERSRSCHMARMWHCQDIETAEHSFKSAKGGQVALHRPRRWPTCKQGWLRSQVASSPRLRV